QVLKITKVNLKNSKFPFMQVVHSQYINIVGRDVQMIERQYGGGRRMYIVTYMIEANEIENPANVEKLMNSFEPQRRSGRMPASEQIETSGSDEEKAWSQKPTAEAPQLSLPGEFNANDPKMKEMCEKQVKDHSKLRDFADQKVRSETTKLG